VEEKSESARQRILKKELEWVHSSQKARQAKGKARLLRYEEMLTAGPDKRDVTGEIYIPPGPKLGGLVVEAKNLRKGYGDRLLIEDLSFKLPPGGLVGVIGPNGAGKTTLFRMIMGLEKPDAGELKVGDSVKLAYVDQSRDALQGEKTVFEEVSAGLDHIDLGPRGQLPRARTWPRSPSRGRTSRSG